MKKLSPLQLRALRRVLESETLSVELDVLIADDVEHRGKKLGGLVKALQALGSLQLTVADGRVFLEEAQGSRDSREFVEYDSSGIGPLLRSDAGAKRGAARFAVRLFLQEGIAARKILIDNGAQVAYWHREFVEALASDATGAQGRLELYYLNPIAFAECLRTRIPGQSVTSLGGKLLEARCAIVGDQAVAAIEGQTFTTTIMGSACATTTGDLGQVTREVIGQKDAMLRCSGHVFVLLSARKILRPPMTGYLPLLRQDSTPPTRAPGIRSTIDQALDGPNQPRFTLVVGSGPATSDELGPARELRQHYAAHERVRVHLVDENGDVID